jgi:hypothetical protein
LIGVRKSFTQTMLAALVVVLSPFAWLHLLFFDRWYLSWGRLKNYGHRRG